MNTESEFVRRIEALRDIYDGLSRAPYVELNAKCAFQQVSKDLTIEIDGLSKPPLTVYQAQGIHLGKPQHYEN
jgi:hypothetical protein